MDATGDWSMTPTNDIPRVITDMPANGKSYSLTYAQISRKKRGESIWNRDKVVAPYEVNKGKFV